MPLNRKGSVTVIKHSSSTKATNKITVVLVMIRRIFRRDMTGINVTSTSAVAVAFRQSGARRFYFRGRSNEQDHEHRLNSETNCATKGHRPLGPRDEKLGKCLRIGGAEGDRTPDLMNAIHALS